MALPTITTIREHIAWSYANLARADAALEDGVAEYQRVHHIIRQRLYSGLVSGRMSMRSLYQDERLKMTMPQACYYCGSLDDLAVDHLIPRITGGADKSDNLIWACRRRNSSKQGRDTRFTPGVNGLGRPSALRLDDRYIQHPLREERQADGRIRRWARVPEMESRALRVILLEDGETVHNAFFDRDFEE